VRAFEREVERIENLQADILEKEFFLRRQKRERQEHARRVREAEEAERLARDAAEKPESDDHGAAETDDFSNEQSTEAEEDTGAQGSRLPPLPSLSVGDVPVFSDSEPLQLLPDRAPGRPGG
jgi:hypothetical protein